MPSFSELETKLRDFRHEVELVQAAKLAELKALLDGFNQPNTDPIEFGYAGIELYELNEVVDEMARMLGHTSWLTHRNNEFEYRFWIPSSWEC